MADEQAAVLAILDELELELNKRRRTVQQHNDYYQGEQPLNFASEDFTAFFGKQYKGWADNWTQVVADAATERLEVMGIRTGKKKADEDLMRVWDMAGMHEDSGLGFLSSIVSGRSFLLVWGDPDDPDDFEMTFEDARECIIAYEPGSRRKRKAALKVWSDGSKDYATLFMKDFLWKFERDNASTKLILPSKPYSVGGWEPREVSDEPWPLPNPIGVVPMVELPNRPMLGEEPISDIKGTIAMQDAINLLWSHLFTASDYAALPQRVVLGSDMPKVPVLDANGQPTGTFRALSMDEFRGMVTKRIQFFKGENAKIDEWSASQLEPFTGAIHVAVAHIAAQTRTPPHYFIDKMANLAAEALKAAETGLVKRVQEKQLYFGSAIREAFRVVALAKNDDKLAKKVVGSTVLWRDAEIRSEAQLVDAIVKLKTVGFPFKWLAERYGLSPAEIARVMEMRSEEQQDALVNGLLMAGNAEAQGDTSNAELGVQQPAEGVDGANGGGSGGAVGAV